MNPISPISSSPNCPICFDDKKAACVLWHRPLSISHRPHLACVECSSKIFYDTLIKESAPKTLKCPECREIIPIKQEIVTDYTSLKMAINLAVIPFVFKLAVFPYLQSQFSFIETKQDLILSLQTSLLINLFFDNLILLSGIKMAIQLPGNDHDKGFRLFLTALQIGCLSAAEFLENYSKKNFLLTLEDPISETVFSNMDDYAYINNKLTPLMLLAFGIPLLLNYVTAQKKPKFEFSSLESIKEALIKNSQWILERS
jgi:DNA-directed RNA polymerase subunit RPC12/RpoP